MRHWYPFILAMAAVSIITTMVVTTRLMVHDDHADMVRSPRSDRELSGIRGNGPPVQAREYRPRLIETEDALDELEMEVPWLVQGAPENEMLVHKEESDEDDASEMEVDVVEEGERPPDEVKVSPSRDEERSPDIDQSIANDAFDDVQMQKEAEPENDDDDDGYDDDDEVRPRKRPKGKRWKGWHHGNKHIIGHSSNNQAASFLPKDTTDNPWWRNSRMCFEVDSICQQQDKNEWFYYTPSDQHNSNNNNLFQPTMELKCAPAKYDGGKDRPERRISIKLSSSTSKKVTQEEFHTKKCRISPTPTHIVLQSLFNDMIGEFYSRTLLRLHQFMTRSVEGDNEASGKKKLPWEEDIQFYVHIPYGNKKMLDGHKLLLSGMLSNPESPAAKSLIDLFVNKEAADNDNGSNDCQCFEKMVFCGYDVYTHASNVKSKNLKSANEKRNDDDEVNDGIAMNGDQKYTLWSAMKLDKDDTFDMGNCGRGSATRGTEYECTDWNRLRNFLSSTFVKHYPTLEGDIIDRRRKQLLENGLIDKSYRGDTKEYAVIGLTQRTYRRAWLNLPTILEECNAANFGRAICVEVNVENAATPLDQLLLHRSLDAMIGVHGAQITQAILLPEHAHVLEMLPWVPNYIRGKWVQTTHGPTPLGVIYHNTDLNHVGYSLDRSSVPMCENVSKELEQLCFMRNRKNFIWENRDFTVDSDAVLNYIENFVMFEREKTRTCEELTERLPERFVLYNIWCSKTSHWYPALSNGEKACLYGTGYPFDLILYDNREDCCAAYPEACLTGTESDKNEPGDTSVSELSLFHNYRREPLTEEPADDAYLIGRNGVATRILWYPSLVDGKKACVHGAEYKINHKVDFDKVMSLSDMLLFENKEDCCAAFPEACGADAAKRAQENDSG